MTDASRTNDSEAIAKPDGAEKTETEKPKAAGEKKERDAENNIEENKGVTVGGMTPAAEGGYRSSPRFHEEVKPVLLFTATSAIAGYASFLLTPAKPALISDFPLLTLTVFATMIAIFIGTRAIVQKIVGKKNLQWIMGNGGAIYLFLWFVSWIIFYNAM